MTLKSRLAPGAYTQGRGGSVDHRRDRKGRVRVSTTVVTLPVPTFRSRRRQGRLPDLDWSRGEVTRTMGGG